MYVRLCRPPVDIDFVRSGFDGSSFCRTFLDIAEHISHWNMVEKPRVLQSCCLTWGSTGYSYRLPQYFVPASGSSTGFLVSRKAFGYALPEKRQTILFGTSLLLTQLLVLLPSHHFLTFEYELYLQSWFQLHAAFLTTIGVFALCSKRKLTMLILLGVAGLLALPTALQVMFGVSYLQSDLHQFDKLLETQAMLGGSLSALQINFFYTGLVWLTPVYFGFAIYQLLKHRAQGMTLIVMVAALLGLAMMLAQFRFQYFGLFFLVLMPMLIIQNLLPRGRDLLIAGAIVFGTYVFSLSYYLMPPGPGDAIRYSNGLPIIKAAKSAMRKTTGSVAGQQKLGKLFAISDSVPNSFE